MADIDHVKIIRRDGLDDGWEVARWTPSDGFIVGDQPFTDDPAYDDCDADQLVAEFDGPDLYAVPIETTDPEDGKPDAEQQALGRFDG